MKKIGMVGIGMMGHGIATNVRKAGYPLGVLEHPGNQPLDSLLAQGAVAYGSARELAADSEVVILCVTGSPQVEAVLCQPDGVLEGLRQGCVIIDCSTAIPSSTLRIAGQVAERGGRFLDAPMTRTPKEAAEGRLNLLVGGDRALFDEMLPLLQSFAENITHTGPVGSGHRMKLLHNSCLWVKWRCSAKPRHAPPGPISTRQCWSRCLQKAAEAAPPWSASSLIC